MKLFNKILPHWSISVALVALMIASSSIIATTNISAITVQAATKGGTHQGMMETPKVGQSAIVNEIVKVDIIDSKGDVTSLSAIKGITLAQAFKNANFQLPMTEDLTISLDTIVSADMTIVLKAYQEKIETKKLSFETIKKEDDTLAKGKTKVEQQGHQGEKEVTIEQTVINEKIIASKTVATKVTKNPVAKIILVGTKEKVVAKKAEVKQLTEKTEAVVDEEASEPTEATVETTAPTETTAAEPVKTDGATLQVEATAYTGGGITATGIHLNDNSKVIAVDPSVIPLGSRVLIDGYGEYIAGDTGGAIHGNIVDLYVATQSEAISFGRRTLTIHIIK